MALLRAYRRVARAARRRGALALAATALLVVLGGAATATWAAHGATGPSSSARAHTALAPADDAHVALLARPHAPAPLPRLRELPRLVIERVDHSPPVEVIPFDQHGYLRAEAMEAVAHAFRASNGCTMPIHPRLIELLVGLSQAFEGQPIVLVSGHREPGHGTRTTSYHVAGLAADVGVRGVRGIELLKAAERLGAGGLGYYGSFIHVDVRDDEPFRWSWRRWRPRRAARR